MFYRKHIVEMLQMFSEKETAQHWFLFADECVSLSSLISYQNTS